MREENQKGRVTAAYITIFKIKTKIGRLQSTANVQAEMLANYRALGEDFWGFLSISQCSAALPVAVTGLPWALCLQRAPGPTPATAQGTNTALTATVGTDSHQRAAAVPEPAWVGTGLSPSWAGSGRTPRDGWIPSSGQQWVHNDWGERKAQGTE